MKYSTKITAHEDRKIVIRQYTEIIEKKDIGTETPNIITETRTEKEAKKEKPSKKHQELEKVTMRSLQRTKKTVLDTVRNNRDRFCTFVTLTFAENITDVDQAFSYFGKYISKVRKWKKRNGEELYYLAVPEFQKRGAIHFHMICNLEVGSDAIPKRERKTVRSEGKLIDLYYYDLPHWRYKDENGEVQPLGYSTAFQIEPKNDMFDLALYMVKYLTKGMDDENNDRLFARQKVLRSQNLRKPKDLYLTDTNAVEQMKSALDPITTSKYWHKPKFPCAPEFMEFEVTFPTREDRDKFFEDGEINMECLKEKGGS